ncbi:MAG: HAMP domain-containing histidine kinase [Lachnospiraceae bacterium]|jgi:signal transduction histidine kinase|nr:HAMP domain-containing histidine kinase [Lachnospiraceae bacterium]MDE7000878.1 HAMP domain-containing histidine kinase [Lachnospiraceae bacterium]
MKGLSVKLRIAVWLTLLAGLLASLLLVFLLSISRLVSMRTAMNQLSGIVRENLTQTSMVNGRLELGDEFRFYQNGVSTLIYSKNKALLAGQLPISFTAAEEFRNGLTREVSTGTGKYLVLDLWVPVGWENGVWLRGMIEAPDNRRLTRNLLKVAMVIMPAFMASAALGSYWIVRKAFRPLDSITATAASINEAHDLSRRIGLPPGQDEFSRLAGTFDQLFQRLELSFESEKQFTADASHELRTPVSVIKGACEYAEKYDETLEERQETIAMIHRQADRMSELIAQLLSMTRLEQGTELARLERVNLNELLRSLSEELPYESHRLILELQKEISVMADPSLLSRLVRNLVENAFKYGVTDGCVWVSACQSGSEVLLQVRDNGIGISADQQDRIWQRFYRVDAARGSEGGAGLGLAIVRQIARAHGGYMTLESIPGKGSTFTLHLPGGREPI